MIYVVCVRHARGRDASAQVAPSARGHISIKPPVHALLCPECLVYIAMIGHLTS